LSAEIIGAKVLFVILGKSFIYRRKIRGPKTEPCGTPCFNLASFKLYYSYHCHYILLFQNICYPDKNVKMQNPFYLFRKISIHIIGYHDQHNQMISPNHRKSRPTSSILFVAFKISVVSL
jgi:hypothetical protein